MRPEGARFGVPLSMEEFNFITKHMREGKTNIDCTREIRTIAARAAPKSSVKSLEAGFYLTLYGIRGEY